MSFREALLALLGALVLLVTCLDTSPDRTRRESASHAIAASVGLSSIIYIPQKTPQ